MAENKTKEKTTFDLVKRIEYGKVAEVYLQQRNIRGADLAIREMPVDTDDPVVKAHIESTTASDQSVIDATPIFGRMYEQYYNRLKVRELTKLYADALGLTEQDNQTKIKRILQPYENQNVGDIARQVLEAQNKTENPGLYSEEEVKAAQKVIDEYKKYGRTEQTLSGIHLSRLMRPIQEKLEKRSLEDLAKSA